MATTDKNYYQLTISVGKALSSMEMPLKIKHARAAIIGTFHSQGAHSFWAVALRQPLLENRIAAWKFCHLLHKVLREGHHLSCQHSMRHRSMLTEMGKLWGHLQDGYGNCIRQYTKLLVTKIEFHERNPRIPCNMALKRGELEQIGGDDINYYFHMAVEMFDYLDDILQLQEIVFKSLTIFHVNSMTPAGQCRVAPLIPCIQDSSPLYDCLVRIMFKLHSHLPNDILMGHRERFRTAFQLLRSFYEQSRNLQYFVGLITIPKLPESAPNFSSQVDFGEYRAPVVVMPEEVMEPEPDTNLVVDDLVEVIPQPVVREPVQQAPSQPPPVDFEQLLRDRDDLIMHLQTEIDRHQKILRTTTIDAREQQARLEEQLAAVKSELSAVSAELVDVRLQKDELELKLESAPLLQQKAVEGEEKAKVTEEKFQKLKSMYAQIRNEHVVLLRTHADVNKQLATMTTTVSDAVKAKEEIQCTLEDLQKSQSKVEEKLQQQHNEVSDEKRTLNERVLELEKQCETLSERAEDTEANKSAEIAQLSIEKEAIEQEMIMLKSNQEDLERTSDQMREELETLKADQATRMEELQQTLSAESESKRAYDEVLVNKQELEVKLNEFELELKDFQQKYEQLEQEKNTAVVSFNERCSEYDQKILMLEQESEEHRNEIESRCQTLSNEKQTLEEELARLMAAAESQRSINSEQSEQLQIKEEEINTLNCKLSETETRYTGLVESTVERMQMDRLDLENDIQDLLLQQQELEKQNRAAQETIASLEERLQNTIIKGDVALRSLLECCIRSAQKMTTRATAEDQFGAAAAGTPSHFSLVADELDDMLTELAAAHNQYILDASCTETFARKVIVGGHLMASTYTQGIAVCNTCADIDSGEHIAEGLNDWNKEVAGLYEALINSKDVEAVAEKVAAVKGSLKVISEKMGELSRKSNTTENVAEMFESELMSMDKAIEEAALQIEKLLSESRATDSGLKLEVNEKVLDACTTLMKAIRLLVQKSRILQSEIVSLGKGTNTAKEFYKRNHQWTEGLISAAKSVAQGANFLLTAANKAVSGEANHQLDLAVAAQEIAASTAQLVVASRVKAPRGSVNLTALADASKQVTRSTATVVATAKDCSRQLEESHDLDNLTVHQAKTMDMEIQVKVLELEQALQVERMRLAAFRRKNYQDK